MKKVFSALAPLPSPPQSHQSANLSVWTLALLNVAAVLSIVNFPEQAEYGYEIIFYIALSACCFFIPTALVSAEIASALPQDGGLYLWGKEAFSPAWGLLTVSMQWLNSLPWYGTVLTFIATTLAFIFDPKLANNRLFVYGVILFCMWFCTILNCFGIKLYARVSAIGTIIGTIIPIVAIILGCIWFLTSGHAPAQPFRWSALLPDLSGLNQFMLLAGMMVALAGIDMTALHITDVKNPRKNFPKAIFLASIFIIIASVLGSLSIALTVPSARLSMASGTGEAFVIMFDALNVSFLIPIICGLLIIGAFTTVFTWILGPSKGLLVAAQEGFVPRFWSQCNRYHVPVRILLLQAVITSTLSSVVLFMPTIGSAFWVLMALSAQLYMTMYLLLFASAFALRLRKPKLPRPYRVPGGNRGMFILCLIGFLTAFTAMLAGFVPPPAIREQGVKHSILYIVFLFAGTLIMVSLPLLTAYYEQKKARKTENDL